jgi:hypothetical protein
MIKVALLMAVLSGTANVPFEFEISPVIMLGKYDMWYMYDASDICKSYPTTNFCAEVKSINIRKWTIIFNFRWKF